MIFDFFRRRLTWPEVDFSDIKRHSRLLVIDDKPFPYQELFEKDGYAIDKWNDVEDLTRLEAGDYDVILLDIQGVGTKYSSDQGFGVLKHLRHTVPGQIIIAYSSAEFSVKYQGFFEMADGKLSKDDDYFAFKEAVNKALRARYSLNHYLSRIDNVSASSSEAARIKEIAKEAIRRNSLGHAEAQLEKRKLSPETVSIVLGIINAAIEVLKTIKNFMPAT